MFQFQGCADVWNKTAVKSLKLNDTPKQPGTVLAFAHRETEIKTRTVGWNEAPTVGSFVLFQFLPARRYASAGNCDRNVSVCPSVCLSVTRRYCVKTKKASLMISSPSGSPKTLVFWRQISSPNSKGFPPNGGLKQGSVGKIQRFSRFKRQYLENGSRYGQSYY